MPMGSGIDVQICRMLTSVDAQAHGRALPGPVHVTALGCEPVSRTMPVSEYFYTPLSPGRFEIDATIAFAAHAVLNRTRIEALCAGVVVPDPAYVVFLVPLRWKGRYLFNGADVTPTSLCFSGGHDGYHTCGAGREGLAIGLSRVRLAETVAALRGVHPDELRFGDGVLQLAAPAIAVLRRRLAAIHAQCSGPHGTSDLGREQHNLGNEVYQLLVDAYLDAQPDEVGEARRVSRRVEIVRRAEDRFNSAGGQPISLADLCAAAGVGRTALQQAFHGLYDESPLRYFHKRRLMKAREALVLAPHERSAVKRAALGAGLTALGRFSVEYRQLFGECPSATVNVSTG